MIGMGGEWRIRDASRREVKQIKEVRGVMLRILENEFEIDISIRLKSV